jgi:hypothetical protein
MNRSLHQDLPVVAAAAAAVAAVLALVSSASVSAGQEAEEAVIYPVVVEESDGRLVVDVMVENASNLAGFQMVLSWDPELLRLIEMREMDYLGSTGREPWCPEPLVDDAAVRWVCATLAPPPQGIDQDTFVPPPGVDGSGSLGRAEFEVLGSGSTMLGLSTVKVADPDAQLTPVRAENQQIRLGGDDGLFGWLGVPGNGAAAWVIGGAVGLFLAVAAAAAATVMLRRRTDSAAEPAGASAAKNEPL